MSGTAPTLAIARVPGSRRLVNDPAPIQLGRKRGPPKDRETRDLLSLNKGDFLRADGTYGSKELADSPIDFSVLRTGSYDQRLLPFIPARRGTMRRMFIDLRETNKQWMPATSSIKAIWNELEELRKEAEATARKTALPLPEYAHQILPLLRFQPTDTTEPFEYQFQPWFHPEAHQARWHRIERVVGQLEGYVNIGHLLLNPARPSWRYSEPVGISLDPEEVKAQDQDLVLAYAYLATPISLPAGWKVPNEYSLLDARKALLNNVHAPATLQATFPCITDLPEDHYDGLLFSVIRPNYSEHRYNADGT
jgi:hypothetical protein